VNSYFCDIAFKVVTATTQKEAFEQFAKGLAACELLDEEDEKPPPP